MSLFSQATRRRVRSRAHGQCEYCLLPEQASFYPHHVDHVIAQKHGGGSDLDNLAWACFQCNVSKGSNIAGYDPETGQLTPLFNPRTQAWEDHFQLNGPIIQARTPEGRVTLALLQFNHPERVEMRVSLLSLKLWP